MTTGELPVPNVTVTQRLLGLAAVRGGHPALAGSSEVDAYTYAGLAGAIQAAAAGLAWRGLHPRDVVGVLVPDAACYALASHAIRAAAACRHRSRPGCRSPISPGSSPTAAPGCC